MGKITTNLHFDLSFVLPDTPCKLHVGKDRIKLVPHSKESREEARQTNSALLYVPDECLTHYATDVKLPEDVVQLLLVTTGSKVDGAKLDSLLLSMIHLPRPARVKHIAELVKSGDAKIFLPHPKLMKFGKQVTMAENQPVIVDVHDFKSAKDAAASIIFHHQELVNIGADVATIVHNIIEYSNGFSDLAVQIYEQALAHQSDPANQNWAFETPYLDVNLKPTDKSFYNWSDITKTWMRAPMGEAIKTAKNNTSLRSTATNAGIYTVQDGKPIVRSPQQPGTAATAAIAGTKQYWTMNNLTPNCGLVQEGGISFDNNVFSVSLTNNWLRWLSGYVEFYNGKGDPVAPENWATMAPSGDSSIWDGDKEKYVTMFSSVDTILGIPLGGDPTEMTFPWPGNAASVRLKLGGIGRTEGIQGVDGVYYGGWDERACLPGAIMTGIFNFGIPTLCMVMGAAVETSSLTAIAKKVVSTLSDVIGMIINTAASQGMSGGNTKSLMISFGDLIPRLLIDSADLFAWFAGEEIEGVMTEATPIFGWIALAVAELSNAALLVQTTVEVAESPATFTLVASRSIDATWTLSHDVNDDQWPAVATHYEVDAVYRDGTTRSTTGQMKPSPNVDPITVMFNADGDNRLPAGGDVKFVARFYSDSGWLAGIASTDFIKADIAGNVLTVPPMNITEFPVPLTASTNYLHSKTLSWDTASGSRVWGDTPSTSTVKDLSGSNVGSHLAALAGITLAEEDSEIGYLWQYVTDSDGNNIPDLSADSAQPGLKYSFQMISDLKPDDGFAAAPQGFNAKPLIAFELNGTKENGRNVWIDPTDSLYHVRPLSLTAGKPFDLSPGQSWGRFNQQQDAAFVHTAGFIIGVNTTTSKIEVLKLGAVTTDANAPIAEIYSGYGTRPGLIHIPVAVAGLPGAGFVVLEAADSNLPDAGARLQAFDFSGNPAPVFANNSAVAALKDEPAGETVLDLAIETKGFMYVLKYVGDGTSVDDYRLDLYSPDGTWLSQSVSVNAAKLCVNKWRTAYTLDFGVLTKPDGTQAEPTVSIWLPSTP
jgi:hypothetical protein